MPLAAANVIEVVDISAQVLGAAGLVAFTVGLCRSGRWRNPLCDLDPPSGAPHGLSLLAVLFAYFALLKVLIAPIDRTTMGTPGSPAWHLAQVADGIARLILSALMLWMLRRSAGPSHPANAGRGWRGGLVGAAAALMAMPLCFLQVRMGRIVWQWVEPNAPAPVHDVLEAIENSAWGPWGVAQLCVSAIVLAPLAEELFFRGLLLQVAWRGLGNAWIAITMSALAFGFVHMSQPQDVLPLVTLGLIFGYLRLRYRTLWVCVAAHAVFNARTIIFAILAPEMIRGG